MPYKHIMKNGKCGVLNNSLTVEELLAWLKLMIMKDKSVLKKAVFVSDDEELNGTHGVYFAPECNPARVKRILESAYWPEDEDLDDIAKHCIIIG